ncbi:ribosome hibernation protein YhbH [Aquipluma nitroreducens]|jgi:putative sigma-54 modulation protein|uniref:Ribosome hibernation protein YhbH n=1 Tax=Aquipluma nitroreducens TaxID=2010828 RepID=A0A5K7SCS8_9BACT|nr:ribosome-associated translation inhibitor RaiA [Aquipluma nitroreducens]BBE19285.1 ribosome hibernation protein YhbH [Aquipluma nitroreducens]
MNIQLTTVHFTADQKLIDFVNKKVPKLDTYFEGIIGAEVILKVEKPETANNKIAEIKLSIPGADYLFAEKQADSFEEAIDLAIEAVRKQLTKFKDKLKDK